MTYILVQNITNSIKFLDIVGKALVELTQQESVILFDPLLQTGPCPFSPGSQPMPTLPRSSVLPTASARDPESCTDERMQCVPLCLFLRNERKSVPFEVSLFSLQWRLVRQTMPLALQFTGVLLCF